jgi:deoxyribonuclease V
MSTTGVSVSFSVIKARKAQACLAKKVISEDRNPKTIRFVAGVDAAYARDLAFGATAVLDYDSLEVLETQTAMRQVTFPYVATLLSFRELPVVAACIRKLKVQPDVLLVDGHGRAHPLGCGLASHLGVALGKPTVGVAKSRLIGEQMKIGEDSFLTYDGEVLAAVVQAVKGSKPIYVSIGHMVSLETAVKIVRHCIHGFRVPERIRVAHLLACKERKAKIADQSNMIRRMLC